MPSKSVKPGEGCCPKGKGGRTEMGGARDPPDTPFIPFLVSLNLRLTGSLYGCLLLPLSVSDFVWGSWSSAWFGCQAQRQAQWALALLAGWSCPFCHPPPQPFVLHHDPRTCLSLVLSLCPSFLVGAFLSISQVSPTCLSPSLSLLLGF